MKIFTFQHVLLSLVASFHVFKAAMLFDFSSPEFLSHTKLRKNQVNQVSQASLIYMNSPLVQNHLLTFYYQTPVMTNELLYTI